MILIGKRLPSQRIEAREFHGKEEMSSRMSSSSSGTKVTKKGNYFSGFLEFFLLHVLPMYVPLLYLKVSTT